MKILWLLFSLKPVLNGSGDELGAFVTANVIGRSIRSDYCLEQSEQVGFLDATLGMDAVALIGVLLDQVEEPQLATSHPSG